MHNAATGRHELEIALLDSAFVACEVFVVDGARQEVCDGLLPTVRMVGEASARRNGEVVEHEEGREVAKLGRAYASPHPCACAFRLLNGKEGLGDLAWCLRGQRLVWNHGQAPEHGAD